MVDESELKLPEKSWYQSRTIWGGIVMALTSFAPSLIGVDEQKQLADAFTSAGQLIGLVMVIYGRYKAAHTIK